MKGYFILALVSMCGCLTNTELCMRQLGLTGEITSNTSYVYFGDNLTLTCSITNAPSGTPDGNLFMKSNSNPHLTSRPSSSIEMSGITVQDRINATYTKAWMHYACFYRAKDNSRVCQVADKYIRVDHRPHPPLNGRCVVDNWESMTCEWNMSVEYRGAVDVSVQYNLTSEHQFNGSIQYSLTSHRWSHCPHQSRNGFILTCEFKNNDGVGSYRSGSYVFKLQIRNSAAIRKDTIETNMTVITDANVKPAPVQNLQGASNQTWIVLQWQHSVPYTNKLYRVRYLSQWDPVGQWTNSTTNDNQIALSMLYPYTNYLILVDCIPVYEGKQQGYWSTFKEIKITTLEDVPNDVPHMNPGSFSCINENCTRVIFYWTPIDEIDRNGLIKNYRIVTETKTSETSIIGNKTTYDQIPGSSSEYLIQMSSNKFNLISLTQATKVGYPKKRDKIVELPSIDYRPLAPEEIRVESLNETGVKVIWTPVEKRPTDKYLRLITYTVNWCERNKKEIYNCKDVIASEIKPVWNCNRSFCEMDISLEKDFEYYNFGVSVEAETQSGKFHSSGIKWSQCLYRQSQAMKPIDAKLDFQSDPTTLRVTWKPQECGPFVLSYKVLVCDQNVCEDSNITEHAVNNTENSMLLTSLRAGITYKIWVIGVVKGLKLPKGDSINYFIPKSIASGVTNSSSGSGGLSNGIIAAICVIVAVVAGVGVFLCIKFRQCIHRADIETRNIDVPVIKTNGCKPPQGYLYVGTSVERAEDEPLLSPIYQDNRKGQGDNSKATDNTVSPAFNQSNIGTDDTHKTTVVPENKRDSGYVSPNSKTDLLKEDITHNIIAMQILENTKEVSNDRKTESCQNNALKYPSAAHNQPLDSGISLGVNYTSNMTDLYTTQTVMSRASASVHNQVSGRSLNLSIGNSDNYSSTSVSNSSVLIDPYVQQTTYTSANAPSSACSVDPYVRQTTDTSAVVLESVGSVDPYVRQITDTSVGVLNSAGSVDPYVRQITDTSVGVLNSAGSVDPYVRQTDTSAGILNSSGSVDPYVRQTDTSAGILDSASSVDPYVRQTDTSAGILDSAGSLDLYLPQPVDNNTNDLHSSNSTNPSSSVSVIYALQNTNNAASSSHDSDSSDSLRQSIDTDSNDLTTNQATLSATLNDNSTQVLPGFSAISSVSTNINGSENPSVVQPSTVNASINGNVQDNLGQTVHIPLPQEAGNPSACNQTFQRMMGGYVCSVDL